MTKGIDISKWQGPIDFKKVKGSGIDFVMIRIGTDYNNQFNLDPYFYKNYTACKKEGLKVGAYFYTYATTTLEAKKSALSVLSAIRGLEFEYPIALDIEDSSQVNLGMSVITEICKEWLETVEAKGYYASIYANPNWLKNYISTSITKRYDLWLAQWGSRKDYPCGMWQFSSKGSIAGVDGNVDLDYAYKDYPTIMKSAGLNGYTKYSDGVNYKKGDRIYLASAKLYATSTTQEVANRLTGYYYLYDGLKIGNNRYRITTSLANCGKTPIGKYVTGYIEL